MFPLITKWAKSVISNNNNSKIADKRLKPIFSFSNVLLNLNVSRMKHYNIKTYYVVQLTVYTSKHVHVSLVCCHNVCRKLQRPVKSFSYN